MAISYSVWCAPRQRFSSVEVSTIVACAAAVVEKSRGGGVGESSV